MDDFKTLLHSRSFRATPGRLKLLSFLKKQKEPVRVSVIEKALKSDLNTVTIYRALDDLVEAGLVAKVDFGHGHGHYEIVHGRSHHHHLVCSECGKVEDVDSCRCANLERDSLRASKYFVSIKAHALEFFGVCKECEPKPR